MRLYLCEFYDHVEGCIVCARTEVHTLKQYRIFFLNTISFQVLSKHDSFSLFPVNDIFEEDSEVVSCFFLSNFEFRIVLLNWLSTKTRVASLPCYLAHNWWKRRRIYAFPLEQWFQNFWELLLLCIPRHHPNAFNV